MASLRELLLEIKIRSDKTEIEATDRAFDQAEARAGKFESRVSSAASGLGALAIEAKRALSYTDQLADSLRQVVGGQSLAQKLAPRSHAENLAEVRARAVPPRKPNADNRTLVEKLADVRARAIAPVRGSIQAPDVSSFTVNRANKDADNLRQLSAALGEAKGQISGVLDRVVSLRTGVVAFGAALVGVFVGRFVGDVIQMGDALDDLSKRTKISVESLQVWQKFIQDNAAGAGPEALEASFTKLSKSMAAAARGSQLQAAAFKELGVEVKNDDGSLRSTEDTLIDVGVALAQMDDDAKSTTLATQLLGASGTALVPAFAKGADAVRAQTAAMREHVAISGEEAAAMGKLDDSLNAASGAWKAIKARLIVAILPLITALIKGWESSSKKLRDVVRTTSILQTILLAVAGGSLWKLLGVVSAFVVKAGGWRAVLSMMGTGLRVAAGAAFRFLTPLLLIEDFLTFLAGGKSLFGRAFEEIFGAGGANKARTEILGFFTAVGDLLTGSILPALKSITDNKFISGAASGAANAFLAVLNLIGVALSDDTAKIEELGKKAEEHFMKIGKLLGIDTSEGAGGSREGAVPQEELDRRDGKDPGEGPGFFERASKGVFGALGFDVNAGARVAKDAAEHDANRKAWGQNTPGNPMNDPAQFSWNMARNAPVPVAPTAPAPQVPGVSREITLNDQRHINVNVGANATPGATGREVVRAVGPTLDQDRRQVLSGVQ